MTVGNTLRLPSTVLDIEIGGLAAAANTTPSTSPTAASCSSMASCK
jgi:hypothetical protein